MLGFQKGSVRAIFADIYLEHCNNSNCWETRPDTEGKMKVKAVSFRVNSWRNLKAFSRPWPSVKLQRHYCTVKQKDEEAYNQTIKNRHFKSTWLPVVRTFTLHKPVLALALLLGKMLPESLPQDLKYECPLFLVFHQAFVLFTELPMNCIVSLKQKPHRLRIPRDISILVFSDLPSLLVRNLPLPIFGIATAGLWIRGRCGFVVIKGVIMIFHFEKMSRVVLLPSLRLPDNLQIGNWEMQLHGQTNIQDTEKKYFLRSFSSICKCFITWDNQQF